MVPRAAKVKSRAIGKRLNSVQRSDSIWELGSSIHRGGSFDQPTKSDPDYVHSPMPSKNWLGPSIHYYSVLFSPTYCERIRVFTNTIK